MLHSFGLVYASCSDSTKEKMCVCVCVDGIHKQIQLLHLQKIFRMWLYVFSILYVISRLDQSQSLLTGLSGHSEWSHLLH